MRTEFRALGAEQGMGRSSVADFKKVKSRERQARNLRAVSGHSHASRSRHPSLFTEHLRGTWSELIAARRTAPRWAATFYFALRCCQIASCGFWAFLRVPTDLIVRDLRAPALLIFRSVSSVFRKLKDSVRVSRSPEFTWPNFWMEGV